MTRSLLVLVSLALLAGCGRKSPTPELPGPLRNRPAALRRPIQPTPPPSIEEDVVTVAVVDADAGPRELGSTPVVRTLTGNGIRVLVRANQQIEVHSADRWDGGVDQLFDNCTFLHNALPALQRSMSPDRYAVIARACGAAAVR